jgi:putative oxygen-independent coproporphyrinogen III oxidase
VTPEGSAPAAGLYLHLPFCASVCPYCDFAVRVGKPARRRAFVDTLIEEIGRGGATALEFDTLYIGGGTPSLLDPEDLGRILETARSTFRFRSGTRLYLEANPEDTNAAALAAWRELGFTTLSLGVQSFDNQALDLLGRRHTGDEARQAVEASLAAGFESVSADLIYGLPGQSRDAWRQTVEQATALGPHHLSCYELTIHEKTGFGRRRARGQLRELPDTAQAELFLLTHGLLHDAGYPAYEVSNFASRPEHRSRHNMKYWDHSAYLGLGPSAHSFDGRRRWWAERTLPRWEARVRAGERAEVGSETLSDEQLASEALMLGLRTAAGVDLEILDRRYGLDLVERNRLLVEGLVAQGQLRVEGARIIPTLTGWLVADRLAASFEVARTR